MALISHGMNVEQMQILVGKLEDQAGQIETLANTTINQTVLQADENWNGPDSTRFVEEWPSYKKALLEVARQLREFKDKAKRSIEEQVSASNSYN